MKSIRIKDLSLKTILVFIGVGVWIIVLQNARIIPSIPQKQYVYVKGGNIDADVSGTVDIDDVRGTVNVSGDVDVDIMHINGQRNVFFNNPSRGEKDRYYVLPVVVQ
jgi:hypothetical protein